MPACSSRATAAQTTAGSGCPDAAHRVILTFGTNDLSSSYSASSFASDYAKGIKAVQDAVDIIVNAIPPLGQHIPTRT